MIFACLLYFGLILLCGIQHEMLYPGDCLKVNRVLKNGFARWRNLLFFTILLFFIAFLMLKWPWLCVALPAVLPLVLLLMTAISMNDSKTGFQVLLKKSARTCDKCFTQVIAGTLLTLGGMTALIWVLTTYPSPTHMPTGRMLGYIGVSLMLMRLPSYFLSLLALLYCDAFDIYLQRLWEEQENTTCRISHLQDESKILCGKCGKEILPDAKFCIGCGQEVKTKRKE